MQSTQARIGIVVAAIAVVVVLFIVLSDGGGEEEPVAPVATQESPSPAGGGGGDDTKPRPEPKPEPEVFGTRIEVEGGQPVGGVQDVEVPAGEEAEIVVTSSDTTEHVHLHGYDIFADLAPGKPARIEFKATDEGVFEMELEDSVTPIAEVTVRPG